VADRRATFVLRNDSEIWDVFVRLDSLTVAAGLRRQATASCDLREIFSRAAAYPYMERRKTTGEMSAAEIAEVLTQVRAGDADAWGELYRMYGPAIFRFCRRALPTREDAEDATTEVFMKVRQKLGTYDSSRPFKAWLYKVASNHCWDMLRRRRIRQDLETGDLETLPLEHPDPSQLQRLQAEHGSKEVRNGLQKLPDRARMALVLRYFAEMSYDEIADTLGVRRAFVGVLLLRARHQLREVLAGNDASLFRGAAGGKL
jgi:RNA polymerase sigma-70 factor (ECF subfamily)